ncbi:MAG: MarP family serine protease [Thermoleophilia bacterium]|nr:MarP family serine protease [Thermoleophilia bacterium]MDH4345347.1 MarP family serine protease [Thermoleophilia bacterium]MDH5333125.1 MarP family serine protease [Thermoleophilia bacterium]
MTLLDVGVLALIALLALGGFRRGLVTGVLSLTGLIGGALLGARVAPSIVGESSTRWAALVSLVGALLVAGLGQAAGVFAGRSLRLALGIGPLRALDNVGGLVLGAITGLAAAWAIGATLLYLPGDTGLRRQAQDSAILSTLHGELPPARLIDTLARIDPFAALAGPAANVDPPDPAIVHDPDVMLAARSVVRITGFACGLGIEGSGWIVAPGFVVTNAHVVAGMEQPRVDRADGRGVEAQVVSFDQRADVAILRVPSLAGAPLRVTTPDAGTAGALLGYPGNGPFRATPVRVGRTLELIGRDVYGSFPVSRPVTLIRGEIRSGNSGGPVVDADGRVLTTVFGGREQSDPAGGYGVPTQKTLDALAAAADPIESDCLRR